jgi:hypothetical protein
MQNIKYSFITFYLVYLLVDTVNVGICKVGETYKGHCIILYYIILYYIILYYIILYYIILIQAYSFLKQRSKG